MNEYQWNQAALAYADSVWAGDVPRRKSTSREAIHTIRDWSNNEATFALSTAEAELYSLVKGPAEGLGM